MKLLYSVILLSTSFLQVQAHMLLWYPWRFNSTGTYTADNGPLVGPGAGQSNYPCKTMGIYTHDFPPTKIAAGSEITVEFQGESVHGGGSCQFALSRDLEPNAQSEFKVFHSIIGNCPARNTPGNLYDDSSWEKLDPFKYPITIPDDISPGKYTFAWSWFNKVGNQEMYMNCAPVEITGGSQKRNINPRESTSGLDLLPDLFLANIPDVKCQTSFDTRVLVFPDPGKGYEQAPGQTDLSKPLLNGADINDCYAPVGSSEFNVSPPSSTAGYGYSSPTSAPVSSSAPTTVPSVMPPYPKNGTAPSTPPSSGSCPSGQVSCPTSGAVICVGSSQFGICNNGCAIPQALAAGTTCSGGVITKRNIRFPPQARPNRLYSSGHRVFGLL